MKTIRRANRVLFLVAMLLFVNLMFCQEWEQKYYVDEFGDPTENGYKTLIAEGTFSNSATQNSACLYKFMINEATDKDPEDLTIKVYEYGRSLATDSRSRNSIFKFKDAEGMILTIKNVFFSKSGAVYFRPAQWESLKLMLTKGSRPIKGVFDDSENDLTHYKFTIK